MIAETLVAILLFSSMLDKKVLDISRRSSREGGLEEELYTWRNTKSKAKLILWNYSNTYTWFFCCWQIEGVTILFVRVLSHRNDYLLPSWADTNQNQFGRNILNAKYFPLTFVQLQIVSTTLHSLVFSVLRTIFLNLTHRHFTRILSPLFSSSFFLQIAS